MGGSTLRALMIDHQDLFVLTPASAFRARGVHLQRLRPSAARRLLLQSQGEDLPDLVILSPGPGRPQDFDCAATRGLYTDKGGKGSHRNSVHPVVPESITFTSR